jgi:putative oxidoreductase
MVAHGWNHLYGGGKVEGTARWFGSIGMRQPRVQAWFASLTELAAGGALVLGAGTSLAAAGVVGPMTVAIVTVHRKNGFFIIKEGWEYTGNLIVAALAIAALGPGRYSVDRLVGLDRRLAGRTGVALALLGTAGAAVQLAAFYRPEPVPVPDDDPPTE